MFAPVPRRTTKEVVRLAETDQIRDMETGQEDGATKSQGENPELRTENSNSNHSLSQMNVPEGTFVPQPPAPDPYVERLRAELEEARTMGLEAHRRALLAENSGMVVPELVAGSTVQELEGSVEVARRAFETARAAVLADASAISVPAGNPVRQGLSIEGMSPLQKIAHGLRRD